MNLSFEEAKEFAKLEGVKVAFGARGPLLYIVIMAVVTLAFFLTLIFKLDGPWRTVVIVFSFVFILVVWLMLAVCVINNYNTFNCEIHGSENPLDGEGRERIGFIVSPSSSGEEEEDSLRKKK